VAIYEAVKADDLDRASDLQSALTPLARAVTKTYGIGGLKAALEMTGFVGGAVRAPLQRPSEEGRDEIAELLREAMAASGNAPLAKVSEPGAVATGS
jgi:4-hydroxy-2-oxoglutarate aldolase